MMLEDRIESTWIESFANVFELCKMRREESIVILAESQSRPLNLHLAELALGQLGLPHFRVTVPTPPHPEGPIVRSSGASQALNGQRAATRTLAEADVVIDLTVEGLMHARQTTEILEGGARILTISNEHPETLARTVPTPDLKDSGKSAVSPRRANGTEPAGSRADR